MRGFSVFFLMRVALSTGLFFVAYRKKIRYCCSFPRLQNASSINFGDRFAVGSGFRAECVTDNASIEFGAGCTLNDYVHIGSAYKVTFGENVLVGSRVTIIDHNHGSYDVGPALSCIGKVSPPSARELSGSAINIGDNVWIGEGVVILPGVKIGACAVIGANSVVTKNVASGVIVVGIPAKVIKKYAE